MAKMIAAQAVWEAIDKLEDRLREKGLDVDDVEECLAELDNAVRPVEAYTPDEIRASIEAWANKLAARYEKIAAEETDSAYRERLRHFLIDGTVGGMKMLAKDLRFWLREEAQAVERLQEAV